MNYKSKQLGPCNFCQYYTGSSCMVRPNSGYCSKAKQEYYAWLASKKKNKQR